MLRDPIGFKRAMLDAKHEYERDMAGAGCRQPAAARRADAAPTSRAAPPTSRCAGTVPTAAPAAASGPPRRAEPLSPDEVTRTLASLADLRDRGAISAEEYEARRRTCSAASDRVDGQSRPATIRGTRSRFREPRSTHRPAIVLSRSCCSRLPGPRVHPCAGGLPPR